MTSIKYNYTEDHNSYLYYLDNVQDYIHKHICSEEITNEDYIPGRQKVFFFKEKLDAFTDIDILDIEMPIESKESDVFFYEDILFKRLTDDDSREIFVVIGGLGSGKSTTMRNYIIPKINNIYKNQKCKCFKCIREPILINCGTMIRRTDLPKVEFEIIRKLRFEIYDRLIKEILLKNGIDISEEELSGDDHMVLRRLLITNDISLYSDPKRFGVFSAELNIKDYRLGYKLFERKWTKESIIELIKAYHDKTEGMDEILVSLTEDIDKAVKFTAIVLNYYIFKCSYFNPKNLIIIDNTDQLPTEKINNLVERFAEILGETKGIKIVFPLRPSSIAINGFIFDNLKYIYHYGPNCFDLIYYRVTKYILLKSREEIKNICFKNTPRSTEEIDAFLISSYVYSLILLAGTNIMKIDPLKDGIPKPSIHNDHSFLLNINVMLQSLIHASQSLESLVGICCRYATNQLKRFYSNVYRSPDIFKEVRSKGLKMGANITVRLKHRIIMSSIFGQNNSAESDNRLVNLYLCLSESDIKDTPCLTQIRILTLLAHLKRVKIKKLLSELSQYGISKENGFEALNYLTKKERLLLWFSKNYELNINNEDDLNQDVVISEHGSHYLRYVINDFEYIWFCANQIPPTLQPKSENFKHLLNEYCRMLKNIGNIEWKQLIFRRLSNGTRLQAPGSIFRGELITLSILYYSLERILGSSISALKLPQDSVYNEEMNIIISEICDIILEWQAKYILYWGNNGYLIQYKEVIQLNKQSIMNILNADILQPTPKGKINNLLNSWNEEDIITNYEWRDNPERIPSDAPIPEIISYAKGFVPPLKGFLESYNQINSVRFHLLGYLKYWNILSEILVKQIPTITFVKRYLNYMIKELIELRNRLDNIAGIQQDLYNWINQELPILRDLFNTLEDNTYNISTICDEQDISEAKARASLVIKAYEEIMIHLGITNREKFNIQF